MQQAWLHLDNVCSRQPCADAGCSDLQLFHPRLSTVHTAKVGKQLKALFMHVFLHVPPCQPDEQSSRSADESLLTAAAATLKSLCACSDWPYFALVGQERTRNLHSISKPSLFMF